MSAAETRSLIERYYAAFNDGSVEGMLALLDEDVAHDVNQGERRIGKDAFKEFSFHMKRCYREHLTDIVIMTSEDGSHGAAEFTVNGTYLATDEGLPEAKGQTYTLPAGSFFQIEDGKIVRVTTYYNLNDWTRQVGG
ncbi:Ketosteroid isomerase-related protein [Hartmannibacter diazotrophicus]|uniref:Ketosteroid isomerase-related protein n=1 Tax=Hartmannibacter diazotrophicus TaxID=1482074 RepID=A0A2C9D9R2_9HYPH|nr:ketosteroid isomerase-related protein [Hartmannibacter diazotrophicus]SON56973.1 Ketosteroid isomerase-related protein [Hartmannibacter diazotrophicus]